MANSKLFLNSINIGSAKLGASDVILYFGEELIYPLGSSVDITYDVATYNGVLQTAQNIVVTDKSGNTLVENVDYVVTENNGGINAGNYPIVISMMGQYQGTAKTNFVINKVTPTVSAPTAISGLIYNSSQQALVNAGSTDYGTLKYSTDGTNYSAAIPSGTTAGTHTVYYKVEGDSNVNDVAANSITASIAKVTPTVVAPTAKVLTYNTQAQELVNAGSTDYGTLKYSLNNSTWSTSIPTATNYGSYTVYYKVDGNSNVNDVAADSTTASIAKVTPTVVAPTAKVLTYNTQAQALVNAGSTNYGTLKYSLDNSTWSTSIPTATNYGSYTVYYKVDGNGNVNDVAAQSVACSINEKQVTATVILSQTAYTYNGSVCEPTVTVKDGSVVINPSEYTVTYSNNVNAGTATVTISDNVGGNYEIIGSTTFTINKADVTYTAPTAASLTYNGNVQELLNAGTVTGGTMKYSADDINWSTDIPSGTNASSYTSYWKIDGDANHNDIASSSIVTTIAKADSSLSFAVTEITIGVGETKTNVVTVNAGDGTVTYSSNNTSAITVDDNGVVSGVGVGDATITANISQTNNCYSASTSYSAHSRIVVVGTFNITSTSSPTRIASATTGYAPNFTKIEIDGVEQNSATTSYIFDTTGNHTVKYYLNSTGIGTSTFAGCSAMTSCTIGSGVTSIGADAFRNCSGLTKLNSDVDGVFNIPSGVTSIGHAAFYNCTSLTSVTIPNSVRTLGGFVSCSNLKRLNSDTDGVFNIPSGVTIIYYDAFYSCTSLTSLTIPDSVIDIEQQAFYICTSLTSVTVESTTPPMLDQRVFDNTNNCPIYVPCDSVNAYKSATNWRYYASRIEAIPGSCPLVLTATFNITDTSNPTRIASGTSSFTKIKIDGVEQPSVTTGYTFSTTGEHTVKYYLRSTSIGNSAFTSCYNLTSIDIPNSVTSIGSSAFKNCSGLTSCTIGSGTTTIGDYAFFDCDGLTSITIPSSVTSIGNNAFRDCTSLTSITIPSGVTTIGNSAFSGCRSLTSIDIPSGVTTIGNGVFEYCTGLTSVTIPDSVTSIGNDAFYQCSGITSITIPSGVTSIGNWAFQGCSSLTSIDIPSGVTSISKSAFYNCSSLTSIDIPSGVTFIGQAAFYQCSSLTSCTIGSSVTTIGDYAFENCTSLTSIVCNATTAPTIQSSTFRDVKTGGTLTVPSGSTGYDVWMGTGDYYLGKYNWTKVEQ